MSSKLGKEEAGEKDEEIGLDSILDDGKQTVERMCTTDPAVRQLQKS